MPAIQRREAVALWLLAFVASALVGTHGILYWDAGDYVRLALDGGQSGLLLGRPLFLLVSRLVLSLGIDPAWAEPVLRWFWTAVGAAAAPAMAILALRLGIDRPAALIAGAALALSPSFAHTAHQVLTDAPALALSIAALCAAAGSRSALAGLFLAAAILTRETAAVHAVAVAMLLGRRAPIALGVTAMATAATLWLFPPPGFGHWFASMAQSAAVHSVTAQSFALSVAWIFAAGPGVVVAGLVTWARGPRGRWLVVSVPAAIATAALLFYPDGSFSPRYMLATVPLAFFLPGALWLAAERRWLVTAVLLIPIAAVPLVTNGSRDAAARGVAVMTRVIALPPQTFVVPGHFCPQARLAATIHHRGDLDMMCPGWEWPPDPAGALDAAVSAGRPVAVDLAEDAWWGVRETPYRDAIRAWAARQSGREIAGFLVVRR